MYVWQFDISEARLKSFQAFKVTMWAKIYNYYRPNTKICVE